MAMRILLFVLFKQEAGSSVLLADRTQAEERREAANKSERANERTNVTTSKQNVLILVVLAGFGLLANE